MARKMEFTSKSGWQNVKLHKRKGNLHFQEEEADNDHKNENGSNTKRDADSDRFRRFYARREFVVITERIM